MLSLNVTCVFENFKQIPIFGYFGPKSINFVILSKFCLYPISKVLISNLTFLFENVEPKSPYSGIWTKKYQLFDPKETLPVPYFQGADFKSDIRFPKF